jgi:Protein of unknown function (DUF1579)
MTTGPGVEHERLALLVGHWKTQGWTRETRGSPAVRIDATDTYAWLPCGFALLHTVDAYVGDQKVGGAEIIGYDPARGGYLTQYFGSDGPSTYEATLTGEGGTIVWKMHSETNRFSGTFSPDGNAITGHWELLDEGSAWRPWMDITLTKQAG